MSEAFVKIGSVSDFPTGSMKKVQVHDEDVLVANISGKIYAIGDVCTHRGCSLSEGTLEGTTVICPCHEGHFDITTGKVIASPPKGDEPSYEVELEGSDVLVKRR
jgi:nitrite reductase/ring-hydroxylating ferredoxin subunit